MRINKQQLLAIEKLNLCDTINDMSDSAYGDYCAMLEELIEKFPLYETELKNLFKTDDLAGFAKTLSALRGILSTIRVPELLKKCDELETDIKNENRNMAETCLTYFLTSVSMLSIEIQMARHRAESESSAEATVPGPEAEPADRQKSILAVDDVSILLSTLRGLLQNTGYKFTGVTSGEAALKFIQNHVADLFLLDIEMPGMDGYELAAELRKSGQTAPIIFLTGNAQSKYVIKAMQMGAADFIVKPVNREQVLEKIKKYI